MTRARAVVAAFEAGKVRTSGLNRGVIADVPQASERALPDLTTPQDTSASILCPSCRKGKGECQTVGHRSRIAPGSLTTRQAHRAALGDAYDLTQLLGAAAAFFNDDDANPASDEIRVKVVRAAYTALAAFISAEKTFRTMHGLTVTPKGARKVRSRRERITGVSLTIRSRMSASS